MAATSKAPEPAAGPPRSTTAAKMLTGNGAPPSPKQAKSRGANRASQIIAIAQEMFYERGYSDTSMDDIAHAVGILKGSLYYYVNSKEDLLFHIVENVHAAVTEHLEAARAMTEVSAVERIVHYVRNQLIYNANNVAELAVYHHDWRRLDGERLKNIEDRRHEHETFIRKMIEEGREAGDIPADVDARLALAHTFAVTIWPYTWYRKTSSFPPEVLAESAARFVEKGLSGHL
jgi:AcrR family transcriptional regulator